MKNNTLTDIAIFGVGGLGREMVSFIDAINQVKPTWNIIGFFDDAHPIGYETHGYKNLGGVNELNHWNTSLCITFGLGISSVRKKVVESLHNSLLSFPTLVHPTAIIADKNYVKIGKGCILGANVVVTSDIEIGNFVLLNVACTVGHDSVLEDFTSFMPTCCISGEVRIEQGVFCGTGVKVINRTSIGANTIVGAGAVVTKPLPKNCTAVGVPAKPIKLNV